MVNRLRLFLSDNGQVFDAVRARVEDPAEQKWPVERAAEIADTWPNLPHAQAHAMLCPLIACAAIHPDRVDVHLRRSRLQAVLRGDHVHLPPASDSTDRDGSLTLSVPARLKRTDMEVRMIVEGVDPYDMKARPDPSLIKLIVKAHMLHDKLVHGEGASLDEVAAREGIGGSYFTRVTQLAWLAPDITKAILGGHQPAGVTAARLLRESRHLPVEWNAQRRALGFD